MTKPRPLDPATIPTPRLAAALTAWAAGEDGYGLRAATRLLIEYNGGRLLDEPVLRRHVTLSDAGPQLVAAVDWVTLHSVITRGLDDPLADPLPVAELRGNACLLVCCALAAGTPLPDLGRVLAYFDGWNARRVLYALYFAMGGDERDAGRGWLAYLANAHLAGRVNVGLLASTFSQHVNGVRPPYHPDQLEGQMSAVRAQAHLSRMLAAPAWAVLPCPDADYRVCVWTWEAAETCRVEVAMTRKGVLLVTLHGEDGVWEIVANAVGGDRTAHAVRYLTVRDLAALHENLRYAGIPVGDL